MIYALSNRVIASTYPSLHGESYQRPPITTLTSKVAALVSDGDDILECRSTRSVLHDLHPCFIRKTIECFCIVLPSLASFLQMHGVTSTWLARNLHFPVAKLPITVSFANPIFLS